MKNVKLFISGMTQVLFVVINTYFISQKYIVGVFGASYMISLIWTYNVKRVSAGTDLERHIYSLGAATGGVIGLLIGMSII